MNYAGNQQVFLCKIVIVYPHLFRCSTINLTTLSTLVERPSVALLSSHFNTLFSFQGAICSYRTNCCFASQNCNLSLEHSGSTTEEKIICRASRAIESYPLSFEARSQNPISQILRSNSKIGLGGPEWARTTDLTIISRTL